MILKYRWVTSAGCQPASGSAVACLPKTQRPGDERCRDLGGTQQGKANTASAPTTSPGESELCVKRLPRWVVCFCLDAVTQQEAAQGERVETTEPEGSCEGPFLCVHDWNKQVASWQDSMIYLSGCSTLNHHDRNCALGRIGLWEETKDPTKTHTGTRRTCHIPWQDTVRPLSHGLSQSECIKYLMSLWQVVLKSLTVNSSFIYKRMPQPPLALVNDG